MRKIDLYTDGACSGNPGRGGWAAVAFNEDGDNIMQCSEGYRLTTNNRMEIMAVVKGLKKLREQSDKIKNVTVYSDSQYVVNTMNLGWARNYNNDLWDELDVAVSLFINVEFVKVKGHAKDKRNNLADEIAVAASQKINAVLVDEIYEKESVEYEAEKLLRNEKVEILEIRLKNCNKPQDRLVEVVLSNGTNVHISALDGGFHQYDCTKAEAAITVDVALRFNKWLNGGKTI